MAYLNDVLSRKPARKITARDDPRLNPRALPVCEIFREIRCKTFSIAEHLGRQLDEIIKLVVSHELNSQLFHDFLRLDDLYKASPDTDNMLVYRSNDLWTAVLLQDREQFLKAKAENLEYCVDRMLHGR